MKKFIKKNWMRFAVLGLYAVFAASITKNMNYYIRKSLNGDNQ